MRTAGPSESSRLGRRRSRTLQRIESGWHRRAGATGALLAVIAVTIALVA